MRAFTSGAHRRHSAVAEGSGSSFVPEQRITILLVDERAWTREAFARALESASRDLRVVRFERAEDLVVPEGEHAAMIVLLNVTGFGLLDPRVSAAVAIARSRLHGVPAVALSDRADANDILAAIEAGLNGYIPISLELRLAVDALRFVAAGGIFVPAEPILAGEVYAPEPGAPPSFTVGDVAAGTSVPATMTAETLMKVLTPRERAVLDRLREGKANKLIARELGMREATVKVHVRHMLRKLGVVNRTQLALIAESLTDG